MRAGAERALPAVRAALEAHGLLLISDDCLPAIAPIVAGERVSGSWWSHPFAHEIYDVCEWLDDQPDVARAKLLAGKVTFVHASLFASLVAVGSAREPWQMRGLSAAAKRLLGRTDEHGVIRLDELTPRTRDAVRARAKSASELELRLLVRGDEVHTETGAHAKRVWSWAAWSKTLSELPSSVPTAAGRARLEAAVAGLAVPARGKRLLPWLGR